MKNNATILQGDLLIKGKKDSVFIEENKNNKIAVTVKKNAVILVPPSTTASLEISVAAKACVEVVMMSCLNVNVYLKKDANVHFTMLELDNCNSVFKGYLEEEGAKIKLEVLSITKGMCMINQEIYHNAPHTESEISNFGVSIGEGKIYFDTTGKIYNKMNASNCRQLSKGLILGENGVVCSKPILLIDEYDVKAYHGASIGKMNEDDLFYLMSRGLTKNEAYTLVLEGIIAPFINRIDDEQIKAYYQEKIHEMM